MTSRPYRLRPIALIWRTQQLQTLGLPTAAVFAAASWVDWHDVARLVGPGCPPELALEIAR